jgi:nucleotide-binding universal stress UspA family protein
MSKVVVSVDGSEASKAAVRWCAEQLPADTVVVAICGLSLVSEFVLSVPPAPSDSENRIEDVFQHEWCQPLIDAKLEVEPRLVHEGDAAALIETAAKEQPGALVVGKEPHHTLGDFFSASPLHQLLHKMPCPLIIVPAP